MKLLKQALDTNRITLDEQHIEKLDMYLQQLNRWNKTYNLTAITDPTEQVYKHIIDSLSVREFISGDTIADVGTGAGLPGIPLAIIFPEKQFTLIDSSQKRIIFIQQALIKLGITNVTPLHKRIEDIVLEPGFDTIISRAFSSIDDFVTKTQRLLSENGRLLAMKGVYPADEITKIPQDFIVENVRRLPIIGLDAERHVVVIKPKN